MKEKSKLAAGSTAVIALIAAIAVGTLALSGCAVFSGAISSINPLADIQASAEKRANAEIASGIGLTGMTRKMMFNVMYAQVFFVGGFSPTLYNLEETQGAVWQMESKSKDDKEASVVTTERALLKKNADGTSWWYLSWKTKDEEWIFEALMDKDMMAKKIRYYNDDVKRVEEAVFEQPAADKGAKAKDDKAKAKEEEKAPPPQSPTASMTAQDLPKYSKGKEAVKVGAGSFKADKIVWQWTDTDNKETYTYTWWIDDKTPGGLVKFDYKGKDDTLKGELVSLKKGYATQYKSF